MCYRNTVCTGIHRNAFCEPLPLLLFSVSTFSFEGKGKERAVVLWCCGLGEASLSTLLIIIVLAQHESKAPLYVQLVEATTHAISTLGSTRGHNYRPLIAPSPLPVLVIFLSGTCFSISTGRRVLSNGAYSLFF